jgi:hypothetical protein
MAGSTFAVTTAVPGAVNTALAGFDHQRIQSIAAKSVESTFWLPHGRWHLPGNQ